MNPGCMRRVDVLVLVLCINFGDFTMRQPMCVIKRNLVDPLLIMAITLIPGDAVYVDLNNDGKLDGNDATRDLGYTDVPEYTADLVLGFLGNLISLCNGPVRGT